MHEPPLRVLQVARAFLQSNGVGRPAVSREGGESISDGWITDLLQWERVTGMRAHSS